MESLKNYLTNQSRLCAERCATLEADHRRDEAVFEKIRSNVFEIFLAIANAAQKQPEPVSFFRAKLDQIPAAWEHSLSLAEHFHDSDKAHIESVKLEAVREIRAFLSREVNP